MGSSRCRCCRGRRPRNNFLQLVNQPPKQYPILSRLLIIHSTRRCTFVGPLSFYEAHIYMGRIDADQHIYGPHSPFCVRWTVEFSIRPIYMTCRAANQHIYGPHRPFCVRWTVDFFRCIVYCQFLWTSRFRTFRRYC